MEEIEVSHSEQDAGFIRDRLNEFNFNIVPHYNHETFNLILREGGSIRAGLVADIYWGWLYVSLLWVCEQERSRGSGSQLLANAEQLAVQKGCHSAHLETHDFQNLEFYQKRGYVIFGKLDDLPKGHTKYYLSKRLV